MSDLTNALNDIVDLFEELGAPYVVMGGIAVRVHGIPRPTHDVDFTVALERSGLSRFFELATAKGFAVPEAYESGWVDHVAGMPLVKLRIYLDEHGVGAPLVPFEELEAAQAGMDAVGDLLVGRLVDPVEAGAVLQEHVRRPAIALLARIAAADVLHQLDGVVRGLRRAALNEVD